MSGEFFTKSAYARRIGVRPSAISNYIARRKLTAPALRADGTIDAALADQQLDIRLETVRRAGQLSNRTGQATPAAEPIDFSSSRDLLRARALSAAVAAERGRRSLELERGRYALAEDVAAEWARRLGAFLVEVETSLPTLAHTLQLDHERGVVLRKWWRDQRAQAARENREAAEGLPPYTDDPDLAHG